MKITITDFPRDPKNKWQNLAIAWKIFKAVYQHIKRRPLNQHANYDGVLVRKTSKSYIGELCQQK